MDAAVMIRELVRDEALRTTTYRCPAGRLTIGVGRNLDDVGLTAEEAKLLGAPARRGAALEGLRITEEQAIHLCRNDIARVVAALDSRLPWWRRLDDVRQRVLANMAFNLGVAGLMKFTHTLSLAEAGLYAEAARAMLASRWADQVGIGTEERPGRALRLAMMMRDGAEGVWP